MKETLRLHGLNFDEFVEVDAHEFYRFVLLSMAKIDKKESDISSVIFYLNSIKEDNPKRIIGCIDIRDEPYKYYLIRGFTHIAIHLDNNLHM